MNALLWRAPERGRDKGGAGWEGVREAREGQVGSYVGKAEGEGGRVGGRVLGELTRVASAMMTLASGYCCKTKLRSIALSAMHSQGVLACTEEGVGEAGGGRRRWAC